MLGIGMDVDEDGVTTDGVKLSMFDVSDPSDVKEIETYVLEERTEQMQDMIIKRFLLMQRKIFSGS